MKYRYIMAKVKTYSKQTLVEKLLELSAIKKTYLNTHAFQHDRYDSYYDQQGFAP